MRATFVINRHRDEDVESRLAELGAPNPNADAKFRYLDCLSKVRELKFHGDREFNIGCFASLAHGFHYLVMLWLKGLLSCPQYLHLFTIFLKY